MSRVGSILLSPLWSTVNGLIRGLKLVSSEQFPVPVVAVGNIVAGGVGKTEVVSLICQRLLEQGRRVTVAMRGYGSEWQNKGGFSEDLDAALTQKFPDEALVLLTKNPGLTVVVGKNRSALLKRYWETIRPDVVILDDGFQHFAIKRNLDILVHDFSVTNPILRDYPFWFSKVGLRVSLSQVPEMWSNRLPWSRGAYELNSLRKANGEVVKLPSQANVFCGIANPQRVRNFLEHQGVKVQRFWRFSDHHVYTMNDVERLKKWNKENGGLPLLTTLKDVVKLRNFAGSLGGLTEFEPLWLDIRLRLLEKEDYFWRTISESLARPLHSNIP